MLSQGEKDIYHAVDVFLFAIFVFNPYFFLFTNSLIY